MKINWKKKIIFSNNNKSYLPAVKFKNKILFPLKSKKIPRAKSPRTRSLCKNALLPFSSSSCSSGKPLDKKRKAAARFENYASLVRNLTLTCKRRNKRSSGTLEKRHCERIAGRRQKTKKSQRKREEAKSEEEGKKCKNIVVKAQKAGARHNSTKKRGEPPSIIVSFMQTAPSLSLSLSLSLPPRLKYIAVKTRRALGGPCGGPRFLLSFSTSRLCAESRGRKAAASEEERPRRRRVSDGCKLSPSSVPALAKFPAPRVRQREREEVV